MAAPRLYDTEPSRFETMPSSPSLHQLANTVGPSSSILACGSLLGGGDGGRKSFELPARRKPCAAASNCPPDLLQQLDLIVPARRVRRIDDA